MKIHQLSIFVENRPGHLITPCVLLAEAGIDIVALSLADTQNYGVLRLIVRDWQQAKKVLEAGGVRATVTEVLAVQVEDHPGGLVKVLKPISEAKLNVEYMYAFSTKTAIKELKPLLWFLAVAATMIGGLYCAAYLIQVSAAAGLL